MTDEVQGGVVKVIELVGSSPTSFSDAVRNAVRVASRSIRHIRGVEVLSSSAEVDGGELANYKVHCKIAVLVEASLDAQDGDTSAAVTAASTGGASPRGTSPGGVGR
jgi:hypothetical protein